MNHSQHNSIVSFIWSIADDVLRDVFVRGKYRDVILPMTVLRRLDALLETSKDQVLQTNQFLEEQGIDDKLALTSREHGSGLPFYNISPYTLRRLLDQPTHIEANFRAYLDGYSDNVRDIIEKFRLRDQIKTLIEADALYYLVQKFTDVSKINLSPLPTLTQHGATILPGLDNRGMGYVFEELLRRFNEDNNEEAGEHFTPRDIIELMVHLTFDPVYDAMPDNAPVYIYDDACGSGGMLTLSKEFLETRNEKSGKNFQISLFGQEVNPETYAICQSDMLISGQNAGGISYGSTLSRDGHAGKTFDFMLANPPYGKSWAKDQETISDKKSKTVHDARFAQVSPRTGEILRLIPASSDGQLLFTVNMLGKMAQTDLGSRIAVVHNGSALFTGDAGSGESNIRRWMLENDWLEAIIGLPLRMFYNTGIATYIWVFSNRKAAHRKNRVQLIDAGKTFHKLRKNLGQKGHFFDQSDIQSLIETYLGASESTSSKMFDNDDFLFRKICVERPLRLRVELSKRAQNPHFDAILEELEERFGSEPIFDYSDFKARCERELKLKWKAKEWTLFRATCCERDERAAPVALPVGTRLAAPLDGFTKNETPSPRETAKFEADPQGRDWEQVPFKVAIDDYFEREVRPHVPDAWVDESQTKIGAEISFTKYFYQYQALRPLAQITREILELEGQSEGVLHRLAEELSQ